VTQFVDAGVTVLSRNNEIRVICVLDNDNNPEKLSLIT